MAASKCRDTKAVGKREERRTFRYLHFSSPLSTDTIQQQLGACMAFPYIHCAEPSGVQRRQAFQLALMGKL